MMSCTAQCCHYTVVTTARPDFDWALMMLAALPEGNMCWLDPELFGYVSMTPADAMQPTTDVMITRHDSQR